MAEKTVTTPSDQEIGEKVAYFIRELAKRGEDVADKNRIVFSAAVNAVMLFITAVKLQTGDATEKCREHVMQLMDEQISKIDSDGDRIINWHDGEARA